MLALCDMAILYLRNVPDEVMDRLRRLAARQGLSVSAAALRELDESTRWVDNAALFDGVDGLDVPVHEVIAAVDEARAGL